MLEKITRQVFSNSIDVEGDAGTEGRSGFYTFVRHLGKMGPPSSLLFLTVNGEDKGAQEEEKEKEKWWKRYGKKMGGGREVHRKCEKQNPKGSSHIITIFS